MPDSYRVTGNLWGIASSALATSLELASYMIAEEGIDFDPGALFRDSFVENPAADSARLGIQQSGVRRFRFPLRLASSWPGPNGLNGLEDHLRRLVKTPPPGGIGYIDVLPENASYAIRFDILDGRVDWRTYSVYRQRIARRDVDLELAVQPFGYLPTTILLASAAGASGGLYTLSWSPGSVIGDMPALAEIGIIASEGPSMFPASGSFHSQDGMYWTTAHVGGASIFLIPSALTGATNAGPFNGQGTFVWGASHVTDPWAFTGVVMELGVSPTAGATLGNLAPWGVTTGFRPLITFALPDIPAWRGNFRLLALMRSRPSHGMTWQIAADLTMNNINDAMASQNPVATLMTQSPASYMGNTGNALGSAFTLLDLGEFTLPPRVGSGVGTLINTTLMRLWFYGGTTNVGIPTPIISCGGIALIPGGGAGDSGILTGGVNWPSVGAPVSIHYNQFVLDSINQRMLIGAGNSTATYHYVNNLGADVRSRHYGDFPVISTQTELSVMPFSRPQGIAGSPLVLPKTQSAPYGIGASVRYRPRFSFLRGI